jgi:hypothetical protein
MNKLSRRVEMLQHWNLRLGIFGVVFALESSLWQKNSSSRMKHKFGNCTDEAWARNAESPFFKNKTNKLFKNKLIKNIKNNSKTRV